MFSNNWLAQDTKLMNPSTSCRGRYEDPPPYAEHALFMTPHAQSTKSASKCHDKGSSRYGAASIGYL